MSTERMTDARALLDIDRAANLIAAVQAGDAADLMRAILDTQPPAVGVDVTDEMVSAGTVLSNIVYNLAQDDRLPEAIRTSLDAARKRWDAALRTGGGGA